MYELININHSKPIFNTNLELSSQRIKKHLHFLHSTVEIQYIWELQAIILLVKAFMHDYSTNGSYLHITEE